MSSAQHLLGALDVLLRMIMAEVTENSERGREAPYSNL